MDAVTELALLFKQRENGKGFEPIIGRVTDLPSLKIKVGDKIVLTAAHLVQCVRLTHNEEQSDIGKEVVLLPCMGGQRFILVGVVQ